MSISHRSNRLKLVGTPSVEKLQNGRFRLTFNLAPLNPRNDWYNANKDRIFADYGTLQSAEMSIDGIAPRTGEAYGDMALVNAQSSQSGDDYVVQFTYETLGSTFIQIKDDTISYTENGLRTVRRESIAAVGTDFQKTVGTSTISSQIDDEAAVTCYLSSYEVDDTDSYRKVTELYVEAGTLSRTEDFVGSQDSLVIEAIGPDPSTPSGFSLASKQESNFEGFQTNRFTFLRNNVQLSQTEDKVGSQLAITQQWFNPDADKTVSGYSLASKNTSDFEGIETVEFRFLKDNVVLSESEDKVGSQLSIIKEVFNGTPSTPTGYSIANEAESDVDGIPTRRFTFLKNDVVLSESKDKVGSQLAIVQEVFNGTPSTPIGYSIANEQESDVDGIPTRRFTFLKDDVELSRGEDKVGSQNAITEQWFKPSASRGTKAGYSLARKEESDVDGIPTERYTFLKPSILSVQQEFNETRDRITVRAFSKTSTEVDTALTEVTANHKLVAESEDDFQGIKTSTYVYELDSHDVISTEENGLRTVTRSLILATGTDYDRVVGNASITSEINTPTVPPEEGNEVTLYLASFSIQDTEQFRLITEQYVEAGTIDEQVSAGPSGLPNTIVKTVRSRITEPTSLGITLSKSNRNVNGLDEYEYRFLEKANGTSPVGTGVNLVSYEKNIQVRKAGVISATTTTVGNGSIAVLNTVPPSVKSIKANVTIALTTSGAAESPVAYNLSNTSASASVTTTRVSPVGVEEGGSLTVSVFNTGATARTTAFPNHYYTGTSKSVSYSTPAQIVKDDDNIIGEALNETVSTSITLSGSNAEPATTGIYQEDVEPVFFNADGTQYFRKTTYTIPTP